MLGFKWFGEEHDTLVGIELMHRLCRSHRHASRGDTRGSDQSDSVMRCPRSRWHTNSGLFKYLSHWIAIGGADACGETVRRRGKGLMAGADRGK